ncbi:hypothetical protein SRB5_38800 [Streptomyces sp. RB5]|uniref:Uncharacterized protein n=1 Tax=Streptomyces smaragdinus TaxID=2585196 RepID=A0A7K0CJR6_9ACTN|nr:hypothetical protein [Streptomyces smaragdinus]MQY13729.1 hypothetical protein [Streptomyces smaragdinus]
MAWGKSAGNEELAEGWRLVAAGDLQGAMRQLRLKAGEVAPAVIAPLVERVARDAGMGDLAEAAGALAGKRAGLRELYGYGYACVERGAGFLAVPALAEAHRLAPGERPVLMEYVAALEAEERHREVVDVLRGAGELPEWPERYLLAYNALLAGDTAGAREAGGALTEPADGDWRPAYDRIRRLLGRAGAVPTDLSRTDLRGWHYVLTGGLLTTYAPYGYGAGMNGRWAYTQDDADRCLHGLHRLRTALAAAGRTPASVSLLPDRASEILGRAAAEYLGLPAVPFDPAREDTLVVAYDLDDSEPEVVGALFERAPGQLLFAHVTCWTSPPGVSADVTTLLAQVNVSPWGERMRVTEAGGTETVPPDSRPVAELVAEILAGDAAADEGDGETPADPDTALSAFAGAVVWPAEGAREWMESAGPVGSNRFA